MLSNLSNIPVIEIREMTEADIPRLAKIRPTYKTNTILHLEKNQEGLAWQWQLVEKQLMRPFDKRNLYDFTSEAQEEIRGRFKRAEDTYLRVADYEGLLVGILDVELFYWNNTAMIWNLMIDLNYRRQGIGRRLWQRAIDFGRRAGVRALVIETQNTNVDACRFYQRMGCQLIGFNEWYYTNTPDNSEFALFWAFPF